MRRGSLSIQRFRGDGAMEQNAVLVYAMLVMFVFNCMGRNKRLGRPHVKHLIIAGWGLMMVSAAGATYCSLAAIQTALTA